MRVLTIGLQQTVLGLAAALSLLVAPAGNAGAQGFDTSAPTAILTDYETGTVLFEKRLALTDMFPVSANAWRTGGAASGGSTMFLPLNSEVSLDDLIKGIIIQSGNDATIVAAEGIAGSVESFAQMMNARAEEIGLTGSAFTNPRGLPDPGQHVTVRDLSVLAAHLIRDYPDKYPLFSETEFTFNDITQRSRNPLLGLGADGLKTGHTSEAGYGLVASAEEGGRRIVLAMNGMQSVNERAEEARKMMTWGLRSFEQLVLVPAGESAGEAEVRGGVAPSVRLAPQADLSVLAARGSEGEFEVVLAGLDAVQAPVSAGQEIGRVQIMRDGQTVREAPLLALDAVEQAPLMDRLWDMALGYSRDAGRIALAYSQEAGRSALAYVTSLIQ